MRVKSSRNLNSGRTFDNRKGTESNAAYSVNNANNYGGGSLSEFA
jgi:hypothetical protein